jgi:hypothetical protein
MVSPVRMLMAALNRYGLLLGGTNMTPGPPDAGSARSTAVLKAARSSLLPSPLAPVSTTLMAFVRSAAETLRLNVGVIRSQIKMPQW